MGIFVGSANDFFIPSLRPVKSQYWGIRSRLFYHGREYLSLWHK